MEQGATIGQWRLGRRLGAGRLGETWLAHDTASHAVALKLVDAGLERDAAMQARLRTAVAQANGLEHPGIVRMFTTAVAAEQTYIISEYVDAPALAIDQPLTVEQACRVAVTAADALAYAHAQGVMHANLKPSNILVPNSGTVRLTDFGQAAPLRSDPPSPLLDIITLYGNAAYLAPELVRGGQPNVASDVYALGLILYAMLAGRPAFSGDDAMLVQAQLLDYPAALSLLRRDLPTPLISIVSQAVSKQPAARYPDMAAFALAIRDFFIPWFTEQLVNARNHPKPSPPPVVQQTASPPTTALKLEGVDEAAAPIFQAENQKLPERRFITAGVTQRLARRRQEVIIPRPINHIKGPTLPTRTLSEGELNARRNRRWLLGALAVMVVVGVLVVWLFVNIKVLQPRFNYLQ